MGHLKISHFDDIVWKVKELDLELDQSVAIFQWEADVHLTCIVFYVTSFVSCSYPSYGCGSVLKDNIYSVLMR